MLAPLKTYNDFAQGYDCRTLPDMLAWHRIFQVRALDDGRSIRLHGLNSALISDKGDAPGKLLVSDFQTSHFDHTPELVDVVLCHHPPDWLMDKASLRNALHTFVPVALFGHEHSTRISADARQVQLFAGAVQPSRRDPGDWLPTYHIVQLAVPRGQGRELLVRIHTREFDKENYKFRARRNEADQPVEEHRLPLPEWTRTVVVNKIVKSADASESVPAVAVEATMPPMPTQPESAQRELLVHFFRLRTPERYAAASEAGLLRDGDDALQPQTMWAEIFRRAANEPRGLEKFWSAVASRTPQLKDFPNPFIR